MGKIPPNTFPMKAGQEWVRMARNGTGGFGRRISLLANHFLVRGPSNLDACFSLYNVFVTSKDIVVDINIFREVIYKMQQQNCSELCNNNFAYDGDKSLFSYGELPKKIMNFTIILEKSNGRRYISSGRDDNGNNSPSEHKRKRMECGRQCRTFDVEVRYATKISLCKFEAALRGEESGQVALHVLDIILRQHNTKKGCLLVHKSFFHDDLRNFVDVGRGVVGCRGFRSSFRPTQGGLSLNIDVTTTTIVKPGPVLDFLLENQNVKDPSEIDWLKARKMLKNLRIRTRHNSMEFKITGLSEHPCNQQFYVFLFHHMP